MAKYLIGASDVGRGALAGPLVAAAVLVPVGGNHGDGVQEDKMLFQPSWDEIASKLRQRKDLVWCQGSIASFAIDTNGMEWALEEAYIGVITGCLKHLDIPDTARVCIDIGNSPRLPQRLLAQSPLTSDKISIVYQTVNAPFVWEVCAASILATTERNSRMQDLAADFPRYGWDTNGGYNTKSHAAAIHDFGLTPHHRSLCREFLPKEPSCTPLLDLFSGA